MAKTENGIISGSASGTVVEVEGGQNILIDVTSPDLVVFSQDGSDLVITSIADGQKIVLDGFFSQAGTDLPPQLTLADGSVISAADVTGLVEEFDPGQVAPAAGGTNGGGGASFNAFSDAGIGDGIGIDGLLDPTALGFPLDALLEDLVAIPGQPDLLLNEIGMGSLILSDSNDRDDDDELVEGESLFDKMVGLNSDAVDSFLEFSDGGAVDFIELRNATSSAQSTAGNGASTVGEGTTTISIIGPGGEPVSFDLPTLTIQPGGQLVVLQSVVEGDEDNLVETVYLIFDADGNITSSGSLGSVDDWPMGEDTTDGLGVLLSWSLGGDVGEVDTFLANGAQFEPEGLNNGWVGVPEVAAALDIFGDSDTFSGQISTQEVVAEPIFDAYAPVTLDQLVAEGPLGEDFFHDIDVNNIFSRVDNFDADTAADWTTNQTHTIGLVNDASDPNPQDPLNDDMNPGQSSGPAVADEELDSNGQNVIILGDDEDDSNFINEDGVVEGGGAQDFIIGDEGSNTLDGGAHNDFLNGGAGNDLMYGGSGGDVLIDDQGQDLLVGGTGTDILFGRGEAGDEMYGGSSEIGDEDGATEYGTGDILIGDEVFLGGSGNDSMYGGNGNVQIPAIVALDLMYGGGGNDYMDPQDYMRDIIVAGDGDDLIFGDNATLPSLDPNDVGDMIDEFYLNAYNSNPFYLGYDVRGFTEYYYGGADLIYGGWGNDIIFGQGGDDLILAGHGNDIAFGGTGNDIIRGNSGNDSLYGGYGDDTMYGGQGGDFMMGMEDDDVMYGDSGNDSMYGGSGEDLMYGGADSDRMYGQSGDDTMYGGSARDSLFGGSGDDLMYGGTGNDFMLGETGDDTMYGGSGNDDMFGGEGNDLMFGDAGDDDMSGDAGNDVMYGGLGADTMTGGSGNDSMFGGTGDDDMLGGAGNDVMFGDAGNDQMSGGAGNDEMSGDDGNDVMLGGTGDDLMDGGAGEDTMSGNAGEDTMSGGDGDDSMDGDEGADLMSGDAGNDTMSGDSGEDTIMGGAGDDEMFGGDDDDLMLGDAGDDEMYGESGNDEMSGGAGNDTMSGGDDDDLMFGNAGNDALYGGIGDDTVWGGSNNDSDAGVDGSGDDLAYLGEGNDRFDDNTINSGTDTVYGGAGNDKIWTGDGDDLLSGGSGNDSLFGEDDDDTLDGDSGSDNVSGGTGDDVLRWTMSDNAGATDTYDGGDDTDTLELYFTAAEFAAHEAAIAKFANDVEDFGTASLVVDGRTLDASNIEYVAVHVDGVEVPVLIDDAITTDENTDITQQITADPNTQDFIPNDQVTTFGTPGAVVLTVPLGGGQVFNFADTDWNQVGDVWTLDLVDGSDNYGQLIVDATNPEAVTATLDIPEAADSAWEPMDDGQVATAVFDYSASVEGSESATVTININGVNDAPVAVDDIVITNVLGDIYVPNQGVLANDTDIDELDELSVSAVTDPASLYDDNYILLPGANRVVNGSFEDLGDDVNVDHDDWATYNSLPGWNTDTDASNAAIEIQEGDTGDLDAQDGNNKMELDAEVEGGYTSSNAHVYQDIPTETGEELTLSFWYSPRTTTSTNGVEVWWNGSLLTTLTGSIPEWQEYTFEVDAADGETETRLEFRGLPTEDEKGGFIDNIYVGDRDFDYTATDGDASDDAHVDVQYQAGNQLQGGEESEIIIGGDDADTIRGGDGDDTLIGGAGNDILLGNDGDDEYQFGYPVDAGETEGDDTIIGFDDGDTINLDALFDALGIDVADRADDVTLTEVDGDTVITVDGQADFSITVQDVDLGEGGFTAEELATKGIIVSDES